MASQIKHWFESEGYGTYVATHVQTLQELNSQIIDALKSSDYFLFINLPRETVGHKKGDRPRRGSVYSNQELAVAHAFGFDHMILVNHKDVRKEGVYSFLVVNTPEFESLDEVLSIVKEAVKISRWENTFSRHLQLGNLRLDGSVLYGDHTGTKNLRIAHIDVSNGRPDIAASDCAAQFVSIVRSGSSSQSSPDQSRLKATGRQGYSQFIWPKSTGSFDLFGIETNSYPITYLLSEADIFPRPPIISAHDTYILAYAIYADRFPEVTFRVELCLPSNPQEISYKIML